MLIFKSLEFPFVFLTLCVLALFTTSGHAAQSPKIPTLVMTSPDSAGANYEDQCSNGGNLDQFNRDKFLKLMLADKKSKLSQLKVALLNEIKRSGEEPRGEGVHIGEWNQTFHD